MKLKYNDSPIINALNECYHGTTVADLEMLYFQEYGYVDRWTMFSDYSLAGGKINDVITFSFLPYIQNPFELAEMVRMMAPGEIKETRSITPIFINFLRNSPFLSFSFILTNHQYMLYNNYEMYKASLLLSLDNIYNSIPGWDLQNPHRKEANATVGEKIQAIRRFVAQNKKHRVFKNLLLITTIGGFLATLVANRTRAIKMGWFSDRDEINDMEKNFSIDLFNITFIQYLYDVHRCHFLAAPAGSNNDEYYADLIKIPDYITGALADYDRSTQFNSHPKFEAIVKGVFADNRHNTFFYNMDFHDGKFLPTCSRILFNKRLPV